MIEPVKKLSHNIERIGVDMMWPPKCKYIYKFDSHQWLESIDNYSSLGIDQDSIKQIFIDNLVMEFRHSLNSIVFGDPAGKEFVHSIRKEKIKKILHNKG